MSGAMRVAALAIAAAGFAAHAQDKPCSKADAAAAEKNVDMVMNWSQLQKAWRDHRHCDTGQVSENFTDAILRLAVEWRNVDALGEAMKDAQFKAFVVKHLRKPGAQPDHESIYSRARASCPPQHAAMCEELAEVVKKQPAAK